MAEVQGLIITLEARTAQLERGLKRANDAQRKAAGQMERRAKQSADKIAKTYEGAGGRISAAFKTVAMPKIAGLAGAAAGIGLVGGVAAIRSTVRDIAQIGDEAKRAGMQVEAFQEWGYVARQNRIDIGALTDGFKELNLRADEFVVTGKGSAAEAFTRLGFTATELKGKLKDPSALMLEIIGRMEGLDKAAQIRVADELFGGTGGERFVELLSQGEDGIRRTIARGRELGAVIDKDMVQKADDLDKRFADIQLRLSQGFKIGAVVVADAVFGSTEDEFVRLIGTMERAREVLGNDMVDALMATDRAVEDNAASISHLNQEALGASHAAEQLADKYVDLADAAFALNDTNASQALIDVAVEMDRLTDAFQRGEITAEDLADGLLKVQTKADAAIGAMNEADRVSMGSIIGEIDALSATMETAAGIARGLWSALANVAGLQSADAVFPGDAAQGPGFEDRGRSGATMAPYVAPPKTLDDLIKEQAPTGGGGGGGGGGRSQDEFAQALDAMNRERLALEAEAVALVAATQAGLQYGDAIEYARVRAELLTAAQRDGKQITPELTAEVDRLAQAQVQAGNAAQKAADDMQALEERGKKGAEALSDVFMSVMDGSMSAEEALGQLLLQMAKVQMQKAMMGLFGDTGIGGVIGGLLGFSEGGFTGQGGKHEPAGVVHRGEYVFSKESVQRLGAGNLDAMHRAAKEGRMGYASGGLVDAPERLTRAAGGRPMDSAGAGGPAVTINAPVTVNANGGTAEQNADLAGQVAEQTERMFRGLVQSELLKQMRPGGMLR